MAPERLDQIFVLTRSEFCAQQANARPTWRITGCVPVDNAGRSVSVPRMKGDASQTLMTGEFEPFQPETRLKMRLAKEIFDTDKKNGFLAVICGPRSSGSQSP